MVENNASVFIVDDSNSHEIQGLFVEMALALLLKVMFSLLK